MTRNLGVCNIALIGGGPTSLYVLEKIIRSERADVAVTIFEKSSRLGAGMPYSSLGAEPEHVTNISWKEMPVWGDELQTWLRKRDAEDVGFGPQEVMPRLLLGEFMESVFLERISAARRRFPVELKTDTQVDDIVASSGRFEVVSSSGTFFYDSVFICTGHVWPREDPQTHFFRSPYPPDKLSRICNHPVALRGSSLTAIDAIRSLASRHGEFISSDGKLAYRLAPACPDFRLVMHSRSGYLPCPRFYFAEKGIDETGLIDWDEWSRLQDENSGFLPLDDIYENTFKALLKKMGSSIYPEIETQSLEKFGELALASREENSPFDVFRQEFERAKDSYRTGRPTVWKEAVSLFSFVVSYAVKHFSAEDMLRYEEHFQPLAATVIAFVPPSSAEQILALHESGVLELVRVGSDSSVEPHPDGGAVYRYNGKEVRYKTYVDCVGQPHLSAREFPFPSLPKSGLVTSATSKFRNEGEGRKLEKESPERVQQDSQGDLYLKLTGVAINDHYQPLDVDGEPTPHLYILAVPLIGGHNPDFSGLDVADTASSIAVEREFDLGGPETEGPGEPLEQMFPAPRINTRRKASG